MKSFRLTVVTLFFFLVQTEGPALAECSIVGCTNYPCTWDGRKLPLSSYRLQISGANDVRRADGTLIPEADVIYMVHSALQKWLSAVNSDGQRISISENEQTNDYYNIYFQGYAFCGEAVLPTLIYIKNTGWGGAGPDLYTTILHELGHTFLGGNHWGNGVMGSGECNSQTFNNLTGCEANIALNNFNPPYVVTLKNDFGNTDEWGSVIVNSYTYYNIPQSGLVKVFHIYSDPNTVAAVDNQQIRENGVMYVREYQEWRGHLGTIRASRPSLSFEPTVGGPVTYTYTASFLKLFNVTFADPIYVEPTGGGGYYTVEGQEATSTTILQNASKQIAAVPPEGWVFLEWNISDADKYTNPRPLSPDGHMYGIQATFKAHLGSSISTATSPNSQRKIASYNGVSHAVYESGGYLWYTCNTGSDWEAEKLLPNSNGAKNPAIAVTERITQVYVHVVFEYPHEYGGHVYHDVHYLRSSDNGNTWEDFLLAGDVEGWASIDVDAVPVIAGEGNVLVVWKYGSDADGGLARQIDPGLEGSVAQPVAHTNNTSRNPAVNVELISGVPRYRIVYETDGGKIYFTEFLEGTDDPLETRQLNGGYDWMSNSDNPSITGSDPFVFVSWDADDTRGSSTVRRVFCRDRQADGTWSPVVSLREGTRPVVQVRPDEVALDLLWQQNGNVMRISRQVQRPIWTSAVSLGQGNSPTIGTATQTGVPSFAAWTTGTAAPYVVNIEELPAPEFEHWTANWNITGISVRVPDYSPSAVFPDAVPPVYKFECEGYVPVTVRCDSNRGFWTKFPLNQPTWPITYTGTFIDSMAMPVRNCWNMIGSISIPVDTGAVWYEPPAIRASVFFKYLHGSGYLIVERLNPGLGYWVKSSQTGYMILQNIPHQSGSQEERIPRDKFIVTSGDGSRQELYVVNVQVSPGAENIEMPPPPPEFDARWETGDIQVAVEPTGDPIELPISVNQAVMPITLEWELDPETGLEYNLPAGGGLHKGSPQTIAGKGRAVFSSQMSYIVLVANGKNVKHESEVPTVFALHQNYPNPFNPTTEIRFDLPEAGTVSLAVYDVLGRIVVELANGYHEAGYHSVTWNASNQASGIYFARFNVTDALGNVKYTKVNKLVLMK